MASRRFYRIVKGSPATLEDFLSHEAEGLRPRKADRETLRMARGVSVNETPEQARETAARFPKLGAYIAEVEIDERGPIALARTGAVEGHYTLWGEPADLLARVVSVVPI